jgi:hypothetical protein
MKLASPVHAHTNQVSSGEPTINSPTEASASELTPMSSENSRELPQPNGHALSPMAAAAAREELQAIKPKEQCHTACLAAAVRPARSKVAVNPSLAAAVPCKDLEHFELIGALDPGLAGGRAKHGAPIGRVDFHVGGERASPQHRVRGHGCTAMSVGAGI